MLPVPLLEVNGLTKTYGDRVVVDGVTLGVDRGEVVVLVGPNGSGKTTSMECIVGLRPPTGGSVRVLGHNPGGSWRSRRLFGVQLQESGLPSRLRVEEAFVACASLYKRPRSTDDLLDRLALTDHRRSFYERLSGGQKRRVNIGLALVGRPPLVVLDEPTSGVDPEGRVELWGFLREIAAEGAGILLSTHDLAEAEDYSDRVLAMYQGQLLLSGPVSELIAAHAGEWRLRVTSPSASTRALVDGHGLLATSAGDRLVVFGQRDEVLGLRAQIEQGAGTGFQDLIAGPVRLEDLYLQMRRSQS